MPATGDAMGTPASIKARVLAQTLAMEVEPFEERTSETSRIVYGNFSSSGMTTLSAPSARAPWPISPRRLGPRRNHVSPVL